MTENEVLGDARCRPLDLEPHLALWELRPVRQLPDIEDHRPWTRCLNGFAQ